jgi:hypothetical protein
MKYLSDKAMEGVSAGGQKAMPVAAPAPAPGSTPIHKMPSVPVLGGA